MKKKLRNLENAMTRPIIWVLEFQRKENKAKIIFVQIFLRMIPQK